MKLDVIHLLPSLSLFGGTPRKVRDLIKGSARPQAIYCWARWEDASLKAQFDLAFQKEGIKVFRGDSQWSPVSHVFRLIEIMEVHQTRLVHGYFEPGLMIAAGVKLLRPKVRAVTSFVGFPQPLGLLRLLVMYMLARRLDRIVYVSRFTMTAYQRTHPFLQKVSSTVIYNGARPRIAPRAPLSGNGGPLKLVTVSGLVPVKNLALLLEVLAHLRHKKNVELVIVGDGPLRADLQRRAAELGIGDAVSFVGYQEDVGSYLASSDIYLHPSLSEGFGLAVVEAMLHGLPVVVARAGALPELVEDDVTGLVVDPVDARAWADSIMRLSTDRALAVRLATAAKARAMRDFSVERFVQEHESLYRTLLAAV